MNKKIIRKRQSLWYNKRHCWNLVDDLAIYLRDSIRGYILCLENCNDQVLDKIKISNNTLDKLTYKDKLFSLRRYIIRLIRR